MLEILKKRIKNEKGLSLVELLAVIVILAIVAAIAVPAIGNIIDNSRDKAALSEATNILSGAKMAYIDKVCDGGSTEATACNHTNLKDFVDGVALPTDLTVTLNSTKEWEITSPTLFGRIKDTGKFSFFATDNSAYKESDIKDALDKGKKGPTSTNP